MTYPNPLKVVSKKLSDNILVVATSFKRFNKVNFGARMALFHYNSSVVVWSAIPFADEVANTIEKLTGQPSTPVSYLIIPDKEHTLAAKLFKKQYPDMKIISMELVDLGPDTPIDYVVTSKYAHKVIDKAVLKEIGITDPVITDNFEFVYLPNHANKELVTYDKNAKIVFEADLIFNLNSDYPQEQFSEALGYPKGYFPHSGFSFITRYLNPDSKVGVRLFRKIVNTSASAEGLRAIYSWDFDQLVMCHGNIITSNAKDAFKKVFGSVL